MKQHLAPKSLLPPLLLCTYIDMCYHVPPLASQFGFIFWEREEQQCVPE